MNTQMKTDFVIQPKKSVFRIVFPIVILLIIIAAMVALVANFKVITVSGKGDSYTLESNKFQMGILYIQDGASATLRQNSHWLGPIISEEGTLNVQDDVTITGPMVLFSNSLLLGKNTIVDGNLVLFSGSLTLQPGAAVRHNVLLFAGNAVLDQSTQIRGNVVAFAGGVVLKETAIVRRDIVLFAGNMQLGPDASVYGKLISFYGELDMASKASLHNDAVLYFGDAHLSPDAQVHGDVILVEGNAILEGQSSVLGRLYLNPESKSGNGNVTALSETQITRGVQKPGNIKTIAGWRIAGTFLHIVAPLLGIPIMIVCLLMALMFYVGRRTLSIRDRKRKVCLPASGAQPMVPGSVQSP